MVAAFRFTFLVFMFSFLVVRAEAQSKTRIDEEFFSSHDCQLLYSLPNQEPQTIRITGDEVQIEGATLFTLHRSKLTGDILAFVTPKIVGDEIFVKLQAALKLPLSQSTELGNATGKVQSGLLDLAVDFGTHYYPQRKLRIVCNPRAQ